MNKPRQKGTWLETAVVNHAESRGFKATRTAQYGNHDRGDVHLWTPDGSLVVIECKNTPGRIDLPAALRQLAAEKEHAGALLGFAVIKRKGVGAIGKQYAVTELDDALDLCGPVAWTPEEPF